MILYAKDREYDRKIVGGKGYGLFRLARYGFRVPDFFVIAAGTDLDDGIFLNELNDYAEKLDCEYYSVRSSGVSEDGADASFAGQYHTELNVSRNGLREAIRKVYASAEGKNAEAYSKKFGKRSCYMAIVVQKQISGIQSGVLFSTAPRDAECVLIERVNGGGEALVSGACVPETLRYRKESEAEGYISELLNAAKFLEEAEGAPVDVEWAYDGELWFLQLRLQTVLSDAIPPIPNRNWNFYVFRDFTVFNHSIQARASQEDIQLKMFGFSIPVNEGLLVCGREFYSDESDAAAVAEWKMLDRGDFFETFLNGIEKEVNRTMRRTSIVQKTDYSQFSNEKLFTAFRSEINSYLRSYVPMMMRPDDYLRTCLVNLVGESRAYELIDAAAVLLPPTYYSNEHACFLRAVAYGNSRNYLRKYEWKNGSLNKRFLSVTESEFQNRSSGLTPARARALLRTMRLKKRSDTGHAREIVAGAENESLRLFHLIRRFTYYRTRTAEISDRYFYYIRKNMLSELTRRLKLNDETLLLYREGEMNALFAGKRLNEAQLIKRKNGEAITFFNGEVRTYFGANAYTLLRELFPMPKKAEAFYGEVACAGEVVGIVKVVKCFADAELMETGRIVVASMTTPDLSLALEKAVGIITDEGGITCHAAIIAREYAVPCLVGTRVATQVLRDGMKVKLDCVNGCFYIDESVAI